MAWDSSDTLVNRDDPIPTLVIPSDDEASSENEARGRSSGTSRRSRSKAKIKEKIQNVGGKKNEPGSSIQDRLFARLLQQVIPTDEVDDVFDGSNERSTKYINRPGFSLPLMTRNFRRFNARVGVVFVFQNRAIRLLTWATPSHTLSFLAIYTFICLNPYLLAVLPPALLLLFIMVPAFITRHPPPPTDAPTDSYSAYGPALSPPSSVKPVSELSKDFFRNMRDLQNSMDDFSILHDTTVSLLAPPTNFSDEPLSSSLFLFLTTITFVLLLSSHILPWRLIFLVAGWAGTLFSHPTIQSTFLNAHASHIVPREQALQSRVDTWISSDIMLDTAPETRDVEIFELQHRSLGSKRASEEWESWIFSPSPHDPMSAERISGDRPKGTRFFEDVQPPRGWEWSDKKWTLDLLSRQWVEERMITGVEIETEGERWVVDIDYQPDTDSGKPKTNRKDWEESGEARNPGEWRRRRWIRRVARKALPAKARE